MTQVQGGPPQTADRHADLTFQPLAVSSERQQEQARGIYEEAFPPRQRTAFTSLREPRDDYLADLALSGDRVVGLAFASRLSAVPWLFLEYMAIDRGRRGGGIGGAVWTHVAEEARREGAEGVVLEVEDPEEPGIGAGEADVRERRIRFWERCGFVRLPVARFVVPHLDGPGTEPLILMASPAERITGPGALAGLVRALYVEGYELPPEHALVKGALAGLEEP